MKVKFIKPRSGSVKVVSVGSHIMASISDRIFLFANPEAPSVADDVIEFKIDPVAGISVEQVFKEANIELAKHKELIQ